MNITDGSILVSINGTIFASEGLKSQLALFILCKFGKYCRFSIVCVKCYDDHD